MVVQVDVPRDISIIYVNNCIDRVMPTSEPYSKAPRLWGVKTINQ